MIPIATTMPSPVARLKRSTAPRTSRRYAELRGWLLRMPVFYKILLANAGLATLMAAACAAFAVHFLQLDPGRPATALFVAIAVGGAAITTPVYAVLLRLALSPLSTLEYTAERVESGDLGARVAPSALADPRVQRLSGVFNRLLDSLHAERERLREVAARAFDAQEAERTRIARELQEDTAQTLSALLVRLRVVRQTEDAELRAERLEELRSELLRATEQVRGFAVGLRSPALQDLGVVSALQAHARHLAETLALPVRIDADPIDGRLSAEGELALFRIVQEALSNVARHADASHARVALREMDGAVEALVEDDGRGFDPIALEATQPCLGLFGMRERALYVGGEVRVGSAVGAGTRIRVRIPLPAPPRAHP